MIKDRKFEGVWIPKTLWLSTDLKPLEKMIAIEINSLDKGDRHCYAGNEHFSDLFGIGTATVTRKLKVLHDKKVIKVIVKQTQTGKKRTIISNLEEWIITNKNKISHKSKGSLLINQSDSIIVSEENSITKVIQAKENSSAGIVPEETSFTEEQFNLGEENTSAKIDSTCQWIIEKATAARDRSVNEDKASQPFTIPRNDKAKYIRKVKQYLDELKYGTFADNKKWDENFRKHTDFSVLTLIKGCPDEVVKKNIDKALNKYLTARNNPEKYDFIARDRKIDLATFFYEYNEKTGVLGVSHFLKYLTIQMEDKTDMTRPWRMLETLYQKDLPKMLRNVYNNYVDFTEEEQVRTVKSILSLTRWWKRNESRLKKVYKGNLTIRFPHGMETFIEHYLGKYIVEHKYEHPISLFPEKKHWKDFCDFIYDETNIDLEVEEPAIKKEKKSEISIEEINRRMEAD